jgi:hypothetical protein
MRVLVCGGRDFDDAGLIISVLDRLHTEKFFTVLIHGNARGADRIADAWASCRGIPREPYEVPQGEWDEIGEKAGPLRNQRMFRHRPETPRPDRACLRRAITPLGILCP